MFCSGVSQSIAKRSGLGNLPMERIAVSNEILMKITLSPNVKSYVFVLNGNEFSKY